MIRFPNAAAAVVVILNSAGLNSFGPFYGFCRWLLGFGASTFLASYRFFRDLRYEA